MITGFLSGIKSKKPFQIKSSLVSKKHVTPRKNSTVQSDPPAQSQGTPPLASSRAGRVGLDASWSPHPPSRLPRWCDAASRRCTAGVLCPRRLRFGSNGTLLPLPSLLWRPRGCSCISRLLFCVLGRWGDTRPGVSRDLFLIVSELWPFSACLRRPISFCLALGHWLSWSTSWLLSSGSSLSGRSTSGVHAGARA